MSEQPFKVIENTKKLIKKGTNYDIVVTQEDMEESDDESDNFCDE